MRKIVLWLLALSLALVAFSGSQANRVQATRKESLVVLRYNNLSTPCSRPVVAGQVNNLLDVSLHPPVYNRRGPHIILAAYYYVPPLMAPASQQWSFFHLIATKLGIEQIAYDGNMGGPWPALSHKDWIVTGVPLTPVVNPNQLKGAQICQ